jgi:hypothetical protein
MKFIVEPNLLGKPPKPCISKGPLYIICGMY